MGEDEAGRDDALLYRWGFHLVRGFEDEGVWQRGKTGNPVKDPEIFTEKEAFAWIAQQLERKDI